MLVLGIDTSTTTGGVALVSETQLIANYQLDVTVTHSARLFPALYAVLHDAQLTLDKLDGIAVALGPGSFTGLRIGIAAAKSLAYLNKIPLVGIPTLDALAFPLNQSNQLVCAILDALRGEIYTALYQTSNGRIEKVIEDTITTIPELVKQITQPCIFTGNGIVKHQSELKSNLAGEALFAPMNLQVVLPSSIAVLGIDKLAHGVSDDPLKLEPRYLRRPEAEIVWERKHQVGI